VNFIPGNIELPLEVKWIAPDRTTMRSRVIKHRYNQRRVEAYALPAGKQPLFGTWTLQFFFKGKKVGEQQLTIAEPRRS
jgi:hypothetical protein